MLKKIGLAIVALVAVLVIVIGTRPGTFHIERSTTIAAPPAAVFPLVNDFHNWTTWSPWEEIDPSMSRTYSGAPEGPGAIYAWAGNSQVGEGKMTILESQPNELVGIRLEFIKPFAAINKATFHFAGEGQGTKVTWAMDGANGFMAKAFSLFADFDALVGGDFEKGLAAMRDVAQRKS